VTDKLIVADVGQDHIEEVDLVEPGKNYGWNKKEGTFLFNPANGNVTPDPSPNPALTNPVAEYSHDDGIAILGGYLYRATTIPALTSNMSSVISRPRSPRPRPAVYMDDLNTGVIRELRIGNDDRVGLFPEAFRAAMRNGEIYALASGISDRPAHQVRY